MTELNNSKKNISTVLLIVLSYLLVVFAALHSADKPVGGGDTWVAMACGRYSLGDWATNDSDRTIQMKILDFFGIHLTWNDPFSTNSRLYVKGIEDCEGWVNQNWLSHILFYELKTNLGEGSIVVYKFIQAILTALFAFWAARALKVNHFLAAACAAFGVLLARSYIDMRPNISTILMAAILITILFKWKAGKPKTMLWLLPVMIIWSNIHGGFIYGIVVMALACGGYAVTNILAQINPNAFEFHSWKKYKWLLIGFGITIFTPMLFSPFGVENLLHPLLIMFGNDGKEWRNVAEWHPLFSEGFGNTVSFIVFGIIFIVLSLVWLVLRLRYKMPISDSQEITETENQKIYPYLPTFDLTALAIIVLTFYMAISSRRFVFLAGVVLAPFMAVILQQIIIMSQEQTSRIISQGKAALAAVVLALAGSATLAVIFVAAMTDLYFAPQADGEELSVFRQMVGIQDQPVLAGEFFDANKVGGIILNEWTNGGYVAWSQTPDEKTGRPACKVYIDGRAQAAYRLDHFKKWQRININFNGSNQQLEQDAKERKEFLSKLFQQAGIQATTTNAYDKLIDVYSQRPDTYGSLLTAMGGDKNLYGKILEREKITAVLVKNSSSQRTIMYLQSLENWVTLYADDRYTMIFRKNAPENKHLFDKPVEELVWPDKFTRNLSLADYYKTSSVRGEEYRANLVKAEALLAEIEEDKRLHIYTSLYQVKSMLGKKNELISFFTGEFDRLKKIIDDNKPLGRRTNLAAMRIVCHYLSDMYRQAGNNQRAGDYAGQANNYNQLLDKENQKKESRLFW